MKAQLKELIESLVFVSLEPLSLNKIKEVLEEFPEEEVEDAFLGLIESYSSNQKAIQIIQSAGGYLFSTKPEYDIWIRRLLQIERKSRLSPAALETLAAVAYHQPITQAEISSIRGVDSSHTLRGLLQKRLIKIVGRKKSPGKPLIYRTSEKFLTYFGLNSLKDLPTKKELEKILEEEQASEEE